MSTLDPPPTIERDGRRFLASLASVPMVYAYPVDEQAQRVCRMFPCRVTPSDIILCYAEL
jgi:hypothetical protein